MNAFRAPFLQGLELPAEKCGLHPAVGTTHIRFPVGLENALHNWGDVTSMKARIKGTIHPRGGAQHP